MRKECLLNSHDTKQNIEAHNEQYNIDKALIFDEEIQEFLSFFQVVVVDVVVDVVFQATSDNNNHHST